MSCFSGNETGNEQDLSHEGKAGNDLFVIMVYGLETQIFCSMWNKMYYFM